jgi:hypothetical protein
VTSSQPAEGQILERSGGRSEFARRDSLCC